MRGARAGRALLAAAGVIAASACSPSRDVVPDTRDVRVVAGGDAGGGPSGAGGYAWVAKRPHGALGLAGAKNIDEASARRIVERLADELEACAVRLESAGTLVEGAARYVAASGERGTGEIGEMQLAPGSPVAANALLCLAAPVRSTPFPPAGKAGLPAILLEATWSPLRGPRPSDAGAP